MAQDKAVDTEKYAGSGRVVSALGKASLFYIPGSVLTKMAISKWGENAFNAGHDFGSYGELLSIKGVKGKGLALTLAIGSIAASIYGLVSGWKGAAKGKAQFEELKSQNGMKDQAIGGLQTQVVGLQQEVGAHRSFAEQHAKKQPIGFHVPEPHGNHAEKHASHGEHASHADAVRASQAEAAHEARVH